MTDVLVQRPGAPANVLIRGARVLDPLAGIDEARDIVVRDGRIGGDADGLTPIDGAGLVVAPGFVDPHVHLRTPGREDCEDIASGTRAAAAGGFVAIVAMPNTQPVVDSADILRSLRDRAASDAAIPTGFYAAITLGQRGETLTEQAELAEAGAVGFSDDGRPVSNALVFRRALQYQRLHRRPLVLHEEDADLSADGVVHEGAIASRIGLRGIPGISEAIAVARDCMLAEYERGSIHICHVSARETVHAIRAAKARGINVTGEVSPHHLILVDADIEPELDPNRHKMNPPLRSADDRAALREGLLDGTLDCIATDHAPHSANEKEAPFEQAPFGVTGLETAFSACFTHLVVPGLVPLETLIRRMSGDAAAVIGLDAPTLRDGAAANLVVIDPAVRWTVGERGFESRSMNNAFTGDELVGSVRLTIAGGQIAWQR